MLKMLLCLGLIVWKSFLRSLSVRGLVKSQALEALEKEGTSCAARSVVTCARTWRPSCVSCNKYFLFSTRHRCGYICGVTLS